MPGVGTKTAITTNRQPQRCLDLTRLISRVGRGPWTGVDRVELAYLTHFVSDETPIFLFVRTSLGYVLLDQSGAAQILARLNGQTDWGAADLLSRLSRKAIPAKRRAESDLRRFAIARGRPRALPRFLRRQFPDAVDYFNTGHSNLTNRTLSAWSAHPHARISVLIHDMIPLDHPHLQRPGTPERFEQKMRRVARYADRVICNSHQTQSDVIRWFSDWGPMPETLVAHLGVDLPVPATPIPRPEGLSPIYFLVLGTIEPRKNHALLLDIWEDFARDMPADVLPHLVIAGSRGWANVNVFRRLDSSHLTGDSIHEWPGLDDAQIASLIKGAAAVLFPSLAEGYGLPPAEAVMLGTPVICGKLSVYTEILGNIPVYVETTDVYSWKQSISQFADRKRAGQNTTPIKGPDQGLPSWDTHFNLVLKVN